MFMLYNTCWLKFLVINGIKVISHYQLRAGIWTVESTNYHHTLNVYTNSPQIV